MMPPGHVAITWGVSRLLQENNSRLAHLDYRLLALSGMGADLIDKPLALFIFPESQASQLIAHSWLINLALVVIGLLWWRSALPYLVAFAGHVIFDRMWNHTESFWWPFFGWDTFWVFKPMNTPEVMFNVYLDIITRYPQVWVIEVIALLYLARFVYHQRLYQWAGVKHFLLTGQITTMNEARDNPTLIFADKN